MFTAKALVCLDFGAGNLKTAAFERNQNGSLSLKQFAIKSLGADGLLESRREKALSTALREAISNIPTRGATASLCAPGFQLFSKIVKLPPVDTAKVKQIVHYEAQQNIPYPLAEAAWDFQILGTSATGEMEALLVAMKAETVESLFRVSEGAGLRLELVEAAPAALCNAFRFNYGDLEGCTLLIDIGAKTSNVLLFENGKFFARTINLGSHAITQDFIAETKLPFARAEELKITAGFVGLGGAFADPEHPHEAALSKIARQVLTRLHIQVNQTIQFHRAQNGGSAPVRVLLAGGGATMPYTTDFFAEKLGLPVAYFNPFRNLTIDPAVDAEALGKVAHALGEVVGLALRDLARCPLELNLIPKSIRQRQLFDKRKPYFIATIASVAAVVFGIGLFYQRTAQIKKEALAELQFKIGPLQKRAEELDRHLKVIEQGKAEADTYSAYLRDRFFWPQALVEMRNLLVKVESKLASPGHDVGVWIENFGTVAVEDDEIEPVSTIMPGNPAAIGPMGIQQWLIDNPTYFERLYPDLYKFFKEKGLLTKSSPQSLVMQPPAPNTNLVTINVKFKAVNLNTANDPSANGRLAFTVAEEFRKSGLFDEAGTKLTGELEEAEMITPMFGAFRFGMTLKLKNGMQL